MSATYIESKINNQRYCKSDGQFTRHLRENNLKKRHAVLDKGYTYEVWLFENKKTYKVLKNDTDFQT